MPSLKHFPTLALNANFAPLGVMECRDAIGIIIRKKAYVVDSYDRVIQSPSTSMHLPSVIALNRYADQSKPAAFTRRNLFLAYAQKSEEHGVFWRCALCGQVEQKTSNLTFEHVVPRSRGGTTCYRNIVLAHGSCNGRKGNMMLHEAGLALKVRPYQPTERDIVIARLRTGFQDPPSSWQTFIDELYWNLPLVED